MQPLRFYTNSQAARGDRHVYATRSRFLPRHVVDRFEEPSFKPNCGEPGSSARPVPPRDLKASMREHVGVDRRSCAPPVLVSLTSTGSLRGGGTRAASRTSASTRASVVRDIVRAAAAANFVGPSDALIGMTVEVSVDGPISSGETAIGRRTGRPICSSMQGLVASDFAPDHINSRPCRPCRRACRRRPRPSAPACRRSSPRW